MAEFTNNPVQTVQPNQPVVLNTAICCPKGYVYHRPESGIVTLRGVTNNCFARYQVTFNGNIAIPDGGTPGPIAIALAVDGEPILTSRAIVTPAAAAENPPTTANFFNVTSTGLDPEEFCMRLLKEAHVLIFPGSLFQDRSNKYARISLLAPTDRVEEAAKRIERFVKNLKK